jgi:hypothetical protein
MPLTRASAGRTSSGQTDLGVCGSDDVLSATDSTGPTATTITELNPVETTSQEHPHHTNNAKAAELEISTLSSSLGPSL